MDIDNDSYSRCKESALRILERSYKTEKEIEQRLLRKGYDLNDIQRVIIFLKEYKLINDKSYVDMYVKDRIKKQGIKKIKYDLIRKGIYQDLVEEGMNNISVEEQEEIAFKIGQKKFDQLLKRGIELYIIKNKLYVYLVGKGYDYSIVQKVTKEIMKE